MSTGRYVEEVDDLSNTNGSSGSDLDQGSPDESGGSESSFVADEILGDPPVGNGGEQGEAVADSDEIENAGTESGEDFEFETATEEQLGQTVGESAVSDLEGIEDFDPLTTAEFGEEDEPEESGSAMIASDYAGAEEFGFLASVIPTLVSTAGPALAKAIGKKVSSRTRRALQRRAQSRRPAPPTRRGRGGGQRDQLLALLASLLKSAESMPVSESDVAAVDESLVESVAAILEIVIGRDDRVRVSATQNVPWRRICALRITFPSGKTYRGTGFFIGPRAVATAGHCVYLHKEGGWARTVEVIPGANGTGRPYGSTTSNQFRSVKGWVTGRKPAFDYGCIVVPGGSFGGRNLGQFGFGALSSSELLASPAVLAGYPGDKPFAELWGMARRIKTVASDQLIYDIDTFGGQSGAPIYIRHKGNRTVVGVHNYGASGGNSATRITQGVYQRFEGWRRIT